MTTVIRAGRLWMMDPPAPRAAEATGARCQPVGLEAAGAVAAAFGPDAGEALAAIGWVSVTPEHIGELGLTARLRPGEADIWDCVTHPDFRRRGLYRALLGCMAEALLTQGCPRLWIGADLGNAPSQRGIAAAGFRPIVDLLLAPLPALQLMWLEGLPGATVAEVAAAGYTLFGERARPPRREKKGRATADLPLTPCLHIPPTSDF